MFKTDGEVLELNKSLSIRADRYCRLEWAEMSRKKEPPPGGGGRRIRSSSWSIGNLLENRTAEVEDGGRAAWKRKQATVEMERISANMNLSEKLNIIVLIIIPIAAVLLGRWLQDRAEKRKDRMSVFKAVMTFRYGWTRESVEALNMIPVVFSRRKKDQMVRNCWKKYFDFLCIQNPDEMQIKQRNDALFSLLDNMAKVLGYKNVLSWEEIQNPYIPKGMVDSINNNTLIQSGMANIVQGMLMNSQASNNGESKSSVDTRGMKDVQ